MQAAHIAGIVFVFPSALFITSKPTSLRLDLLDGRKIRIEFKKKMKSRLSSSLSRDKKLQFRVSDLWHFGNDVRDRRWREVDNALRDY